MRPSGWAPSQSFLSANRVMRNLYSHLPMLQSSCRPQSGLWYFREVEAGTARTNTAKDSMALMDQFMSEIESIIPAQTTSENGEFLVKFPGKLPATSKQSSSSRPDTRADRVVAAPHPGEKAVVFVDDLSPEHTQSLERGGPRRVQASHSELLSPPGSYSVDLVRGGSSGSTLSCSSDICPTVRSPFMFYWDDYSISGAQSATVDTYILVIYRG